MTLNELFELEKATDMAVKSFKAEIINAVRNAEPPEGVTVSKNGKSDTRFVEVTLDVLRKNGYGLAPETYIPRDQAALIEREICNLTSSVKILERVKEMVKWKKIRVSNGNQSFVVNLNSNTVNALEKAIRM